jgi:prolyl-tRNA editing enzyme YbaK/EbsC (Cys-tRNA(Pro) deacylase)
MSLSVPGVRTSPVSAHTASDAANALNVDIGRIAKSLVFYAVVSNEPILIIASGSNRVDKDLVGEYLGFKIKTASPDYCLQTTGYPVGGVPPFSHKLQIRTLLDKDLLQYDTIWASAGTPNSLFPISPKKLAELADAEIVVIQ